ncbi:MAG: glycosyltransferase [Gammaproteobacteria bacterium]|nr:glycosyltransferase [Gammaproteobacteria bacterium]
MKILFVTSYGVLPDVVGGLQTTLHELCLALKERGAEPAVLCGYVAAHNNAQARPRSDESLGYPVIRMPDPTGSLTTVAAVIEPDAIVVLTGDNTAAMVVAAMDTGLPTAVYIHNVEFREFGGILLPDPNICYFSNSEFTARRLHSLFGIHSEVLLPLVQTEKYRIDTSREKILFINPSLLKGVEIFFRVAEKLPDLPFRVFESWNLTKPWLDYCYSRLTQLPNVEWCSPTNNIETLYGSARMLIMPSVWEEAYGRSAIEAQINGIPVISSRRGGLPEAVGEGGILLEPDTDIEFWVEAINKVYSDPVLYQELSDKAKSNATRLEHSSDYIVATLLTTLRNHFSLTG